MARLVMVMVKAGSALVVGLVILPFTVHAQSTIPQAADIIVVYDNAEPEDQARHSFLFSAGGDATLYACDANKCNTETASESGITSVIIYKLPEGFPRPQGIADQKKLQEFADSAEQRYVLDSIDLGLKTEAADRPYYIMYASNDGSFTLEQANYNKPLINHELEEVIEEASRSWLTWLAVGVGIVLVAAAGILLWRKRRI